VTEEPASRQRILFLASSAPRFAGDATAPFILNMARDLCDLGWQVEILAPHAPGIRKVEVIDGVTIRRFQYLWPAAWQRLCYNGGAAVNLKRNWLNSVAIPFLVAAEFLAALRLLLRIRPALVHSHWIIPQGAVGQVLALTGVPHVISVHGADVYGFRGRMMRAIKRWSLRRCDHVVANSTSTKAEVEALCRPAALSVIPTGTTPFAMPAQGAITRESFASAGTRIILYVGRLIEAKGVRYLIEAMPGILAQRSAKLIIVGEGPERAALERRINDLNLQQASSFVGSVPHSTVYDYFSIADVFVGPSIHIPGEWTEAQGNTFVEALFARIPVVASRVGGIPDAIIHERTGLLVDERAPTQIADAVLRILSDQRLTNALKDAGHAHAVQNFSRMHSARRLDRVYRSVLALRSKAGAA
jgi:glycosyltransferase involved in cell wall biosynthesis